MMIDAGSLIYGLLTADAPAGATVSAEVDVDAIDSLPTIMYSVSGSGQTSNGDGYWNVFLDLNVIGSPSNAFDIASALYDAVHAWVGVVREFGWVHEVTDISLFSTVPTPAVAGRQVVQYAGSFALSLRK